jgi:hypothetical protein
VNAIVSTLRAFVAAGVRPQTPLARSIMLVLVIKLITISGIGAFMLSGSRRPAVDSASVSHLIGPSVSQPNERGH